MAKLENAKVEETTQTNENSLMEIVKQLQKQVEELSNKDAPAVTSKKERYNGPLQFSYKVWDGMPVSTYESIRKDSSKPLRYKSPNGEYIDNHYVVLKFADGKESKNILAYDFGKYHTLSDKQTAGCVTKDGDVIKVLETKHLQRGVEVEYYTFDHPELGTINIYPNCLN